jgi:hypothetical protein
VDDTQFELDAMKEDALLYVHDLEPLGGDDE